MNRINSIKAACCLLLLGLMAFSRGSYAFTYPDYCIQGGGSSFDCNQDFAQDGPATCSIRDTTTGATVEDCYQAAVAQFSQYLSTVDSGTIPRIIYSAIPYSNPGEVKKLVPSGYYSIPNGTNFYGSSDFSVETGRQDNFLKNHFDVGQLVF